VLAVLEIKAFARIDRAEKNLRSFGLVLRCAPIRKKNGGKSAFFLLADRGAPRAPAQKTT
jgi:hypothetical protein